MFILQSASCPAWDIDPEKCLFTQNGNPDWSDANMPWVQHVTKRSDSGLLNVSFHKDKGKYYARVCCKGRTHCSKCFEKPEQAAAAAYDIRRKLADAAT